MNTPHDRLFRGIFSKPRHARALLQAVLPSSLSRQLDLRRLRIEQRTYIDEHLREQITDLLILVRLGDHEAYIYVLLEHQSTVQALMPVRILGYLSAIWKQHLAEHPQASRVPMIVPVVMYHGAAAWSAPISMDSVYECSAEALAAVAEQVPRYSFLLADLLPEDDEALWRRVEGMVPQVILWALTFARREPDLLAAMNRDIGALLAALAEAPSSVAALGMLFTYTMRVARIERERLARFLETEISPMAQQVFTNTYDEIVYESRRQVDRERLIGLLKRRFGAVSPEAKDRIMAAEQTELDAWYKRLFDADSVAVLLGSEP
ncbi:Rpn family recombination-promoting nuclease/putative transposase [Haliangium sp.]|uniref:Rpn family recombination-promoting nuclease/putative transposase n=1 Tax=Haliangium sp. TaxID=2663208 RepID=UPI003D0A6B51